MDTIVRAERRIPSQTLAQIEILERKSRQVDVGSPLGIDSPPKVEIPTTDKKAQAASRCAAGEKYYAKGEYAKARDAFRYAIWLDPDNVAAHFNLGNVYYTNGEYAKARDVFRYAIELDPDNVAAHFKLGEFYYARSEYDRAEASFSRVIELDPCYAPAHLNLASVYYMQGHPDKAQDIYRQTIGIGQKFVKQSVRLDLSTPFLMERFFKSWE